VNKLTTEGFAAARDYIMAHGRPVDQARFRFHFHGDGGAAVIRAVESFQNDDGGFGHGLEPDLRTPASSAIATSMGLSILREVDAGPAEPAVAAAVDYLIDTYDTDKEVWPIVPPAVEDAPHAPWWTYAGTESAFGGFRINPKAALLGDLFHFAAGQEQLAGLLDSAASSLMATVDSIPDEELGMHDLLALLDLANAKNVPPDLQRPLVAKLRRAAGKVVATDPGAWSEYGLQPLQVAPAPDALLATAIDEGAVQANLDYEIARQAADGSWPLTWSWDFVDATAWAKAEQDWKGYHAVNILRRLAAYDRLAGA